MSARLPDLLRLFSAEADPYFVREWILLLAWVYSTYLLVSSGGTLAGAVDGGFSLPLLLYGSVLAGLMGLSLETGRFGHFWTLPMSRWKSLFVRTVGYVAPTVLLFMLPLGFLVLWATFPPSTNDLLPAFALTSTTLLFYVAIGGLVAALTKSAVASSSLIFFPFLILPGYVAMVYPSDLVVEGVLGGLRVLSEPGGGSDFGLIVTIQVIVSLALICLTYQTLRESDLRSGR
jgi:hypothetical protein